MLNILKKLTLILPLTMTIQSQELCPIKFQFYDAGVPQWLDKETILERLKSKASKKNQDPLIERLMEYINRQDCAKAIKKEVSFDLEQAIHEKSFIHQKSFNCKNASKKLNSIKSLQGGGNVVILRGSRRVLLALVGEKSFCIQSSSYDGARLNDTKLDNLYNRLFGDYIAKKIEEYQ
jgi:hypothetical protein